jgi:hypothetical protein
MPIDSFSPEPIANKPACRRSWFSKTKLSAALAVALALLGGGRSDAATLTIGNVNTFATGFTAGNPIGTWTLDDKDYTYLSSSGWLGVNGPERLTLNTNANVGIFSATLSIGEMSAYPATQTLVLNYQVHINGSNPGGPWVFAAAALNQNVIFPPLVTSNMEVFGSYSDWFNSSNNLTPLQFASNTTNPPGITTLPGGFIDLWVRDTITLTQNGSLNSLSNTLIQQSVPEIDPNSFGSALSLALGALAVLERRARRLREICLG